jgi:hypothetical protein
MDHSIVPPTMLELDSYRGSNHPTKKYEQRMSPTTMTGSPSIRRKKRELGDSDSVEESTQVLVTNALI